MDSTQSSLLWFVARGSGMVDYLLLTATAVLGIAVSKRWHSPSWPRIVVEATHRTLTLAFFFFLILHVGTLVADPFSHITLGDAMVPFTGTYRVVAVGLGVIAMELAIAIAASVLVRDRIGYRAWHALHVLTYLLLPLSFVQGVAAGSDTGTSWAMLTYAGSVAVVLGAFAWRRWDARLPSLAS